MSNPTLDSLTTLQLGDIISFDAPVNPDLHDRVFLIKYVDGDQIVIVDEETLKEIVLSLDDDGNLTDQSVEAIAILDRMDEPGYARQNGLVPGKWVNMRFGGDVPVVITGEITNLEEDMIELKTHPDGDTIYIDFAYKGVPKNLPIEKIELRGEPDSARKRVAEADAEGEGEGKGDWDGKGDEDEGETDETGETGEAMEEFAGVDVEVPVEDVKAQLREMIIGADQIQIGEDLGVIEQEVNIDEGGVRYGLEKQVNDMLDDMLSTIPNAQRTQTVLTNIHRMIDRFVELRQEFSTFDEQGNANAPALHGASHKPLVDKLMKLNHSILWLLPIAKNRKKLFVSPDEKTGGTDNAGGDDGVGVGEMEGVIEMTVGERETEVSRILQMFKENRTGDGQNKYDYMIQQLNPILEPFASPVGDAGVIDRRTVADNITAVIDNLGEMSAMTIHRKNIVATRFLITKYELGENKLQQTRLRNGQLEITRVPVTNPQNISVRGFLSLPEHVSRFSRVNMPRTNIMVRSELAQHYVNYWQILRKTTAVDNTIVENLDEPVDYDKATFLKRVRAYTLDTSLLEGPSAANYERFADAIMPKTRVLFELVKRHIANAYSLHNILEYLEPFFVYHKDLSFKQYEAMTGYIRAEIKNYKKSLAEARKEFLYIQSKNVPVRLDEDLIRLLDTAGNSDKIDRILNQYDILTNDNSQAENPLPIAYHTTEQLARIIATDNGRAYTAILSAATVGLMVPDGELLEDLYGDMRDVQTELASVEGEGNCGKYVIAKKYVALDELEADNDADVYFDKKFDRTDYSLLKEYDREKKDMGANFLAYLADQIARNSGVDMTPDAAEREARAVLAGKRLVEEGDFAVLVGSDGDDEDGAGKTVIKNYVRRAGQWVLSDVQDNLLPTVNLGAFCATQEKCVPTGDGGCENAEATQLRSEVDTLKDSIKFFAELYPKKRAELSGFIQKRETDAINVLREKAAIEFRRKVNTTRAKYLIGEKAVASDTVESPYAPLRELILSQGDFVKKQYDILRFVSRFTFVKQLDDGSDDAFWLYCNVTGVPLLPTYMPTLADAFVNYPDTYVNTLEGICADRGTISDDGENWVDKHSGYVICPIQYDTEEGYTAQGYKVKTRAQMEADLGDAVLMDENKEREFEGVDADMVASGARALALLMGVDMNTHLEFIVRNVLIKQKAMMVSEEMYERLMEKAAKAGKKRKQVSYEDAYISNLMYLMFCYYVIALQSSIPEVKTNKTFPGCKRAFTGYPIDGTTDMSAVAYVACLVQSLSKSKEQPWKSLAKESEANIIKRVQVFMDKSILNDPEIQEKFALKKEYLRTQVQEEIPVEHDIKSWTNFLPPLVTPEVAKLQPLAKDFQQKLLGHLRNGSMEQFKLIAQAQSRVVDYSVAIQGLVHKVVSAQKGLLNNASSEPFLQNACCETKMPICLDYFVEREADIARYNNVVKHISELLKGTWLAAKAPILYDPRDTRIVYPPVSKGFSEDTIYQAIIAYCRFNSPLPVAPELLPICHEKPTDLNINDDMPQLIAQLKRTGRVYTRETLDALMGVVNKEHIVHIDTDKKATAKVQKLRDVMKTLGDMEDSVFSKEATERLTDILDVFDFNQEGKDVSLETRQLRNHLSSLIRANTTRLEEFITGNVKKMTRTEKKRLVEFLNAPTNLPASSPTPLLTAQENGVYRDLLFAQSMVRNIVEVIPNMVINGAKAAQTPQVPIHWGLSMKHRAEVIDLIQDSYKKIVRFYGQDSLNTVLRAYYSKYRLLAKMMENLVYLAPMPGFPNITVLDDVTVKLIVDYIVGLALAGFAELAELPAALEKNIAASVRRSGELRTMTDVSTAATGDIDALAIMRGERQQLREKVADFTRAVIEVMMEDRRVIDYDYDKAMADVHRVKEKEKDGIVADFAEMTDEQREIEDLFKRSKLGKWSKGLKKSVFQYVPEDYDEERESAEKRLEKERRLGRNRDVTDMNRDIYMEEMEADDAVAADIEADAYDMSYMGEDDDDGYDPDE